MFFLVNSPLAFLTDLPDLTKMYKLLIVAFSLLSVVCVGQAPDLNETIDLLSVEDYDAQETAITNMYRFMASSQDEIKTKETAIQKALLDGINSSDPNFGLYHLMLDMVTDQTIQLNEPIQKKIVNTYSFEKIDLRRLQAKDYEQTIWEDDNYLERRYQIGLLLDLMGYLDDALSLQELQEALTMYEDKKMRLFASCSLIKRGVEVSSDVLESVAEDKESRIYLYDYLDEVKKKQLFPKNFMTQVAFSESDMSNWLTHPMELGRPPDDLDLLKVYKLKFKGWGKVAFYLWRFRSNHEDWKEKDWMVGLSGPYQYKKMPTTDGLGFTFSNFTPLKEHAFDNHFKQLIETVITAKQNQ